MMKRSLLALLIPALLATGGVQAAEIYNKDGNKVDLNGKINVGHLFSDDTGNDGDVSYARFGFKGETQIAQDMIGSIGGEASREKVEILAFAVL